MVRDRHWPRTEGSIVAELRVCFLLCLASVRRILMLSLAGAFDGESLSRLAQSIADEEDGGD